MNTREHGGKETGKMSESKKKLKDKRLKKHLHLNIPEELYEFLKENGLNASQLVENLLKRLRLGLGESFKTESADLVFVSQNNLEKGLKQCCERVTIPRSPDLSKPEQ